MYGYAGNLDALKTLQGQFYPCTPCTPRRKHFRVRICLRSFIFFPHFLLLLHQTNIPGELFYNNALSLKVAFLSSFIPIIFNSSDIVFSLFSSPNLSKNNMGLLASYLIKSIKPECLQLFQQSWKQLIIYLCLYGYL